MNRVYNFSAGPSTMPLPVLEEAQKDMLNYHGTGMSVMEMSHRSKDYQAIIDAAEADLRDVMGIPDNYKVLFLQGGGFMQFSMVPLNLFRKSFKADYIVTGGWAEKAAKEAKKFGTVNVLASSKESTYSYIPKVDPANYTPDADYFYICYNNTLYGTEWQDKDLPQTGDVPLVADMSSNILSRKVDVSKFGLIFAGAQKNLGPAGVTIVIIREDLLGYADTTKTPILLDYKLHADNGSMFNTPPTYGIYMAGLMFKWIKSMGGVEEIQKINEAKAKLFYDTVDNSKLFKCPVAKEDRSNMNALFVTGDPELDKKFVAEAKAQGMVNLAGHRSVGGMRASMYNAMPMEGVEKLVKFMKEFEAANLK
ncbi:MAG: 3-phosphoserine/phosphohydroxythreonine transaminase [Clostridiales bacterium]|nr:3-phosphoserine/phosphohydroxythreonine transaminase [Clostridiales bacterium]